MVSGRPTEQERVRLWRQKNTWPPQWHEESDAYKAHVAARELEIMDIPGIHEPNCKLNHIIHFPPGADERWENWM